jgi:hypothetical protein
VPVAGLGSELLNVSPLAWRAVFLRSRELLRGRVEVGGGAKRSRRVRLLKVIVDKCRVRAHNDVFCLKMFKECLGLQFPFKIQEL